MEGSDGSDEWVEEGDRSDSDGSRLPPLSPLRSLHRPPDSLACDAALAGVDSLVGSAAPVGVNSLVGGSAPARVDSSGGDADLAGVDSRGGDAVPADDEAGAVRALPGPQLMQASGLISSNKKRSRDDGRVMENTKRKTMRDASCQTDNQFPEVEARDQSRTAVEMVPLFQMRPPMPYQMLGPWWQSGQFSLPIDSQMGHSQFQSPVVSPMSPWTMPSPTMFSPWTMPCPTMFSPSTMPMGFGSQLMGLSTSPGSQSMGLGISSAMFSHTTMGLGLEHVVIGGTDLPRQISNRQTMMSSIPNRPNMVETRPTMGLGISSAMFSHTTTGLGLEHVVIGGTDLPRQISNRQRMMSSIPNRPNMVETRPRSSNTTNMVDSRDTTLSARWLVGSRAANVPTPPTNKRTPPPQFPPYPKGHDLKALKEWNKECREVSILVAKDPVYNLSFRDKNKLPLLEKPKEVVSKRDKDVVHKVASSLVNVSSVDEDGVVVRQGTGVILGPFKESGPLIVLTTFNIICDASGNLLHHKVVVRKDNNESDGKILFYDSYYKIAFLGISNCCLLARPSLLSTIEFGDEVFVISTDRNSSLLARKGKVLWFEKSYLGRNFYKYLSCKLPKFCIGGPVVDHGGNIGGMALIAGIPNPVVIPSSIIMKCIEMYKIFGRIARPEHGISLRTLECLDVTTKQGIMVAHKINNGYIVDKVLVESVAEKFDIRLGDIIVSFDGMSSQSLLELELHLLSLGCEFLQNNLDSSSKIIIELQVYDPLAHCHRKITLPVGFSSSPAGTTDDGNMK